MEPLGRATEAQGRCSCLVLREGHLCASCTAWRGATAQHWMSSSNAMVVALGEDLRSDVCWMYVAQRTVQVATELPFHGRQAQCSASAVALRNQLVVQRDLVERAKHAAALRSSEHNGSHFSAFSQCDIRRHADHPKEVVHPRRELREQPIRHLNRNGDTEQGPFIREDNDVTRHGLHHVCVPIAQRSTGVGNAVNWCALQKL